MRSSPTCPERNLVIDTYEPPQMRRALNRLGVNPECRALTCGDYVISDSACIERKTLSDFLSSMYSGRLDRQLKYMAEMHEIPILLIEGRTMGFPREFNIKSYYGYLSKITLSSPVKVLHTPDVRRSALLISLLAKRNWSQGPTLGIAIPRCRSYTKKEYALAILASFPGIGPVLAGRILEKIKCLRNLFHISGEEISEIEGLGPKKSREIESLLDFRLNE